MVQDRPDPAESARAELARARLASARQARRVGIVLAATIVLWLGGQWLGGQMGWDARYVFLFDLAAIAGFVWALVVTYQIWRGRQG